MSQDLDGREALRELARRSFLLVHPARFSGGREAGRRVDAALCLLILGIGILAYWPVIRFNFFWEDPADIGQVDAYSYRELLFVPNSDLYYRPLLLVGTKLLKGTSPSSSPLPFHVVNVGSHLLGGALVYAAARHWFGSRAGALGAAVIFLLYPPGFEATARSIGHSVLTSLSIGALWLYGVGRVKRRPGPIWLALLLASLAPLVHENGAVLPGLILALELYLRWRRRVSGFSGTAFLFVIPAALFLAAWLSVPKPAEPSWPSFDAEEPLYLSQGLTFPIARLISQTGGWGLEPDGQAALAILLSATVLGAGYGRAGWPRLALPAACWAIAISLAWLALPIAYLRVSPRVMYFPSFAAAMAWAGLVAGPGSGRPRWRQGAGVVVVAMVALQSWLTLDRSVALYRAGSRLMDEITAAGRAGGRLVFVNVPDRFAYREPLYPLGYWGMLVAPVSQKLSAFVRLATGVSNETTSVSDFPMLAQMVEASPYSVNTRGEDVHATQRLYETILWGDGTYLTVYHPSGEMSLRSVGDVGQARPAAGPLGRFGDTAELLGATARAERGTIDLVLRWSALKSARPTDTIFVHVFDAAGELVGQADGDSLGGLLPPSAWRVGHQVEDRRTVVAGGPLPPGRYRIAVGMYDRATGQRYPAYDAAGSLAADGALHVMWFVVS